MDQKSWLWKKRSAEKTLASDKTNNSITSNEEDQETEVQEFITEKEEPESDLRLSAALSDFNSKDRIVVKVTQEAIAGWERAKREAISLKKDLDKVSQQKAASEERLSHLEAALKECMQQLHFVRDEQERRIHSAVIKTSEEFQKAQIALNEKLVEAGKRIARLDSENNQFHKALSGKDKVLEGLSRYRTQAEGDLKALRLRVESTEKENASLKYEICVLEKELDIRNEEAEVNRRTADTAQKQQKESVKKVAKLESECQRLRLLVRRRLPGPAALTRMKNEVDMLGKDRVETRRRGSNPSLIGSMEFSFDGALDTPSRRINFLTEQLLRMEEENRSLQCALENKSFKGQMNHSLATLSDLDSDDKASCAESSSTSVLMSENENFKNEKKLGTPSARYRGMNSEMNLMDDFAEMEKLAIVSHDYPPASSHHSYEEGNATIEKDISTTTKNDEKLSNVSVPIRKILELLEGINLLPQDNEAAEKDDKFLSYRSLVSPTGYIVRVFQWKGDELSAVLQKLSEACNDLLDRNAEVEQFIKVVASSLEWVMNHCFSIQDVSSMKDAIRTRMDWDETRSESGEESGLANHSAESMRLKIQTEDRLCIPMDSPSNVQNTSNHAEEHQSKRKEEANNIYTEKDITENLLQKKESMRQSIRNTGDHIEKLEMTKEDLESQLMETDLEQRKACQKISETENRLKNGSNSFERQEETCNEQMALLKRKTGKDGEDEGKASQKLQTDWEISEKLAECQETLLNLGKQLKAMASPTDAALFDKVISTPADHVGNNTPTPRRIVSKRLSLQDKMLEEDTDQNGCPPRTTIYAQNENYSSAVSANAIPESRREFTGPDGVNSEPGATAVAYMAIVPRKKMEGKSLWKKLFLWKKNGNRKKAVSLKLRD